jgi:hypothetical protein
MSSQPRLYWYYLLGAGSAFLQAGHEALTVRSKFGWAISALWFLAGVLLVAAAVVSRRRAPTREELNRRA